MTSIPLDYHGTSADQGSSATTHAYHRMLELILTGDIESGARVSAATIADSLGMSHIPVREALQSLHANGFVDRVENRGYFVPEKSVQDLEDIYHLRRLLENEAHRLAIPRLSEDDFETIRTLIIDIEEGKKRGDWMAAASCNYRLHFLVFERSGSPRLINLLRLLWQEAARYYLENLYKGGVPQVNEQHRQLLRAYERQDIAGANEILDAHRSVTLDRCREALSE